MLERLKSHNFRKHKELDIEFGPGITTITGDNYAGKSTIIRNIKWVTQNLPAGLSVINWDAEKAVSRLEVDSHKITRTRSKSKNSYKLDDGEPFGAFGNDVPEPIAQLLNISDLNFQGQHDAPFWFCQTSGEVSKQLNKIVNLDIIDKTQSNLESQKRETTAQITVVTERLKTAKKKRDELLYVDEMNKDLTQLENLQQQITESEKSITQLSLTITNIALLQKASQIKIPDFKHIEKLKKTWDGLDDKIESLDLFIEQVERLENQVCMTKKLLTESEELFRKEVELMENICPVMGGNCPRGLKAIS